MVASNTNLNGWILVFDKNNKQHSKPIDDPFVNDVEKTATSFYVSNFPNPLDAKNLWKEFQSFSRIVDAFITNKHSKQLEDSSIVALVKVKEIDTISNMYYKSRNAGFADVKIHFIGGLWVRLQFTSVKSCSLFKSNEFMKKIWTCIKDVSPSFIVDERMIWIEISGLPLCAWGSIAFQKVANTFCIHIPNDIELVDFDDEYGSSNGNVDPNEALNEFIQQMIKVGGALGYDVKGCKKSLRHLIDGTDVVKEKWAAFNSFKPLHVKLKELKMHLKLWMQELENLERLNSMDLVKKLRIKWKVEGDENSKIFHGLINPRIKSQTCHDSPVSFLPMVPAHRLNSHDRNSLETMVSLDEIKAAIWDCGSQKALGLDARNSILEGLHMALNDGLAANLFHGIKASSLGIHLSHQFYADDSNVYGIGVSSNEIETMASYMGCEANSLPFTYLVHEIIVKSLESLRAFFFWGGIVDSKKLAWVKWSKILTSMDKGGLGVGSLKAFDMSLLLKQRWRLFQNPIALWVHVVKAIHGDEAGIDLSGHNTKGVWASIVGTINHLHSSGIVPLNSIRFNVGDGSSIRFWKDTWLGDAPLYIRFNILYHLENNKDFLIQHRIANGYWAWDWSRPVNVGRTKAEFDALILDIASIEPGDLSFLRSSAKLNLSSSSNLLPSCALVKKNMISEFAEALTPL
ncbi:hypothetical protein Tco_1224295 [Tanacetum coccineum]